MNKQKMEERYVTESYYTKVNGKCPQFIKFEGDHPDCYIKVNDDYIAVELTRYYNQVQTKNNQNFRNSIKNLIKNNNDNILEILHKKIGKKPCQTITIKYGNMEKMIQDIIGGESYIESITIKDRYDMGTKIIDGINNTLLFSNITSKKIIKLSEYLYLMNEYIREGETIGIYLIGKNKKSFYIKVKYNKYANNKEDITVAEWDVWYEDRKETFKNILLALQGKIEKYKKIYVKDTTVEYDKYVLILYSGDIPSSLSESEIKELFEYLKKNIVKFLFDEIVIKLFNKDMIIKDNNYEII